MTNSKPEFDALLRVSDRARLRASVESWPATLSMPQVRQLVAHASAMAPELTPLRFAFIHTYTSELLDPWLDLSLALSGFRPQTYHAPYGLALAEAAPESRLVGHKPEVTVLLLRREDMHPDLALPLAGLPHERRAELRRSCLGWIGDVVGRFRAQPIGHLVLTLLPSLAPPALGIYDAQSEHSEGAWFAELRAEIAAWIRSSCPSTLFMDLEDVANHVGRAQFFDRRLWHSAQFPFAPAAAQEFARRIAAVVTALKHPKAKVLVLDADNTLWGGVIGEDGMQGIAIGPDYPGSAYREFQRRILDFRSRGLILALCSKNNPADVDEVLRAHPHQILRDDDFAARRVNWLPKPDNLIALAEELNLGLESFVFVDDSDHECEAVRTQLPQVQVVQVPSRALDVASCLDKVARLEVLSLTREDLEKSALYAQESRRARFVKQADTSGSPDEYLSRLDMKMRVTLAPLTHVARLSQLTKKTNQFNLTTRRYEESEITGFIASPEWLVADFSLADHFGDSGIVGLAMFRLTQAGTADLDTLLMSCRVIGRKAESAFLQCLLRLLAKRGVTRVLGEYVPTTKNVLVENLLPQEGFEAIGDGRYQRLLDRVPARSASDFPIEVHVADG